MLTRVTAEKAGLHEGDLIIKVQAVKGKAVAIKDGKIYHAAVNAIPAAKPIIFTVLQKGQELPVQLIRSSDKFGLLIQPPSAAAPQTIRVASDGTGDCKSIDGALLRSRPGDTILIKSGKYGGITVQPPLRSPAFPCRQIRPAGWQCGPTPAAHPPAS